MTSGIKAYFDSYLCYSCTVLHESHFYKDKGETRNERMEGKDFLEKECLDLFFVQIWCTSKAGQV